VSVAGLIAPRPLLGSTTDLTLTSTARPLSCRQFTVERMLGTALVLATLDAGYVINKKVLKELVKRASLAPWVIHPHRYTCRQ
jgi:hypothetical protein